MAPPPPQTVLQLEKGFLQPEMARKPKRPKEGLLPIPALPDYGRGIAALARFGKTSGLPREGPWEPYTRQAEAFRKHHCRMLAIQAGGVCGAAPSTIVTSAAAQMAVSQFLFDQGARDMDTAQLKLASQMANDSRTNLLAAYELAIREAQALRAVQKDDPTKLLELALAEDPDLGEE